MKFKNKILFLAIIIFQGLPGENLIPNYPQVTFETTEGKIVLELDYQRAPITVRNFLELMDKQFYDNTIFHRVISDFMIQGGGFNRDLDKKESSKTIPNESGNGIPNLRGTIAMARLPQPHTAGSQFFINVIDNRTLNPGPSNWGYAVFGYVIDGMNIVDKISKMPTSSSGQFKSDVPIVPVIVTKAYWKKDI